MGGVISENCYYCVGTNGTNQHRGYLVLMIIKSYLLTTKPLITEVVYCLVQSHVCRVLGRFYGRTQKNVRAQNDISYANSRMWCRAPLRLSHLIYLIGACSG